MLAQLLKGASRNGGASFKSRTVQSLF